MAIENLQQGGQPEDYLPITPNLELAINQIAHRVNDWADKKGWNEDPLAGLDVPEKVRQRIELAFKNEQHMLFVTEIAEGVEFLRKKGPADGMVCQPDGSWVAMDDKVPELTGEEAELADLMIRVFHYVGKRNIDLGRAIALKHNFNITRPYRHGKSA